jgi:hypothetical protein
MIRRSTQQREDRLWPEAEDEGSDGECGDAEFADGRKRDRSGVRRVGETPDLGKQRMDYRTPSDGPPCVDEPTCETDAQGTQDCKTTEEA